MPGPRERWKLEPGMRQDVFPSCSRLLLLFGKRFVLLHSSHVQAPPALRLLHPMFQPPGERWLTSISRNLGKGVDFDAFYSNVHT